VSRCKLVPSCECQHWVHLVATVVSLIPAADQPQPHDPCEDAAAAPQLTRVVVLLESTTSSPGLTAGEEIGPSLARLLQWPTPAHTLYQAGPYGCGVGSASLRILCLDPHIGRHAFLVCIPPQHQHLHPELKTPVIGLRNRR